MPSEPSPAVSTTPTAQEIRAALPHTWHAFFGRFGQLRPIQTAAAPPLLAGRDALVCAPTAGGKTEAAMAPLVERHAINGRVVLVVSPTRALVNDLYRRLQHPLRTLGLTVARRTGDHKEVSGGAMPSVLVTTPESLDSMLCRMGRSLVGTGAVLIDELHLFAGTARGDQLRCLLARLEHGAAARPQRCGLSATVAHPARLAAEWLGADAAQVIIPARRQLKASLRHMSSLDDAAAQIEARWPRQGRKVLVFANARAQVEGLGAALGRLPRLEGRVFLHHGSLARGERLRVERAFLDAPAAICVATSTMELGVDIGDIDLVAQLGPPPDVSALLQRIGRGNRRGEASRMLAFYEGAFEAARWRHLLSAAAEGRLFDTPVPLRPTVWAQQALSLAFQNPRGWTSPKALRERLPDAPLPSEIGQLFEGLVHHALLRPIDGGRYVPEPQAEHLFETGKLHSTIVDTPEVNIVDASTGAVIGRAAAPQRSAGDSLRGHSMALGGKRRVVQRMRDGQIFVRTKEGVDTASFRTRGVPRYPLGLAQDLKRTLRIPSAEFRHVQLGGGVALWHFLGSEGGLLLAAMLKATGRSTRTSKGTAPFMLVLGGALSALPFKGPTAVQEALDKAVEVQLDALCKRLGAGAFAPWTPHALKLRWVRDTLPLVEYATHLSEVQIVDGVHPWEA